MAADRSAPLLFITGTLLRGLAELMLPTERSEGPMTLDSRQVQRRRHRAR